MPIGHGTSLARRRLGIGKSVPGLSGGVGARGDYGQAEPAEPTLARKASLLAPPVPVPQTDTGGRGEYPKVNEITLVKELGNITP